MPGEYLLDTSVVVPLFRGEKSVEQKLDQVEQVFLSAIVLGELFYGAKGSDRSSEQVAQVEKFAKKFNQLGCDGTTARNYGWIKQMLRSRGRPIPENDLWIAATALQYKLVLATRDDHFKEVDGLATERW